MNARQASGIRLSRLPRGNGYNHSLPTEVLVVTKVGRDAELVAACLTLDRAEAADLAHAAVLSKVARYASRSADAEAFAVRRPVEL